MLRLAVVGHVEWIDFARVPRIPRAGEVAHARDLFSEPAGGGAVVAVQMARLAGEALLVTALGADELGDRSVERLGELGVRVLAARREAPTRRGLTLVDEARERTIVTLGERLEVEGEDDLPWEELAEMDAVYFTAGDLAALRRAASARVLIANPRAGQALGHGVPLDALVLSDGDALERELARQALAEARLTVFTQGEAGGRYTDAAGESGSWPAAAPAGPILDSYGAGDCFAAGLAYGLGAGLALPDALSLGARCGAECMTGRGPYERQLTRAQLQVESEA